MERTRRRPPGDTDAASLPMFSSTLPSLPRVPTWPLPTPNRSVSVSVLPLIVALFEEHEVLQAECSLIHYTWFIFAIIILKVTGHEIPSPGKRKNASREWEYDEERGCEQRGLDIHIQVERKWQPEVVCVGEHLLNESTPLFMCKINFKDL